MCAVFQNPVILQGTVYVVSDFHLGSPNETESRQRELKILQWLDEIGKDATHLVLLGDIFDFWFEYKDVVPKGYYKLLSKLSRLRDKNIEILYFTGNHDMWVKDYFVKEMNFSIFREQHAFVINGKKCLMGHGDGLGPEDIGYKLIKSLFAFRPNIKLYGALHPRHAFAIARFFSRKSRAMTSCIEESYMGDDKEQIVNYARSVLKNEQIDFFIYAHRHLPLEIKLNDNAIYFNSGDWLIHDSYIRFGQDGPQLLFFKTSDHE
jgi:UDP-2,3-diacylglucosamine hydrolase